MYRPMFIYFYTAADIGREGEKLTRLFIDIF